MHFSIHTKFSDDGLMWNGPYGIYICIHEWCKNIFFSFAAASDVACNTVNNLKNAAAVVVIFRTTLCWFYIIFFTIWIIQLRQDYLFLWNYAKKKRCKIYEIFYYNLEVYGQEDFMNRALFYDIYVTIMMN